MPVRENDRIDLGRTVGEQVVEQLGLLALTLVHAQVEQDSQAVDFEHVA